MSIESSYNEMRSKAFTAIDTLNSYSQWNSSSILYDKNNPESPHKYLAKNNEVTPIDLIKNADSILETVIQLANDITNVQYNPPADIGPFEMLKSRVWEGEVSDQIQSNILSYIDSMGIPDKEFQDAIFNKEYDRKLQTLNDLFELADAKVGARGFTYNNSLSTALKLDAQQKYQFDKTEVGREILRIVTDWARQNYQFAIDKGISFEQWNSDFTYKYCTGFVEIYKNLLLTSVERLKADLAQYLEPIRALLEAAKLPIELGTANAQIAMQNAEMNYKDNLKEINEAIDVYKVRAQSSISDFQTQVNGLAEVAKQTSSFAQAVSRTQIDFKKL